MELSNKVYISKWDNGSIEFSYTPIEWWKVYKWSIKDEEKEIDLAKESALNTYKFYQFHSRMLHSDEYLSNIYSKSFASGMLFTTRQKEIIENLIASWDIKTDMEFINI